MWGAVISVIINTSQHTKKQMLHIPTLAELEEQIRQLVENAPPSEIVCDKAYLEWAATLEDTTVEFV